MLKQVAVLAAALLLAGAAQAQSPNAPRDTGSMAYPEPLPQGQITTTAPAGSRTPTDIGSMAYPSPLPQGGSVNSAAIATGAPTDTGSMAHPAPIPQNYAPGNIGSTAPVGAAARN